MIFWFLIAFYWHSKIQKIYLGYFIETFAFPLNLLVIVFNIFPKRCTNMETWIHADVWCFFLSFFFFLIRERCKRSQKFWSGYLISCVQKYTKTKEEEEEKFCCRKYFVPLREWASSVCFAFLLSPSVCKTSQPTSPACLFVQWGKHRRVAPMCLTLLSAVLSDVFQALPSSRLLPLFHPWKQRVWWGQWGGIKEFDWPGPELCRPFPKPSRWSGVSIGPRLGGDRLRLRVLHSTAGMIFKISEVCIRYLEFSVGKIKPFTWLALCD